MDFLIYIKWSTFWPLNSQPPSIITLMINLPLNGADPGNVLLWGDGDSQQMLGKKMFRSY